MANDCLVKKLAVNNSSLPKFGILDIDVFSISNFTEANSSISIIAGTKPITVKVVEGSGYMGNSWATLNSDHLTEVTIPAGVSKAIYFSDFNGKIEIDNKYYITRLLLNVTLTEAKSRFSLGNLSNLDYPSVFNRIEVSISGAKGDISVLKNIQSLEIFKAYNNEQITGDVSEISIPTIQIEGTKCYGDFTSLLEHSATNAPQFTQVLDSGHGCSADFSKCSSSVKYIYIKLVNDTFIGRWPSTTARDTSLSIVGFMPYNSPQGYRYVDFGDDLDNMLINQAACPAGTSGMSIAVNGNRTSASDAAVTTLKSKGYSVSVNGTSL